MSRTAAGVRLGLCGCALGIAAAACATAPSKPIAEPNAPASGETGLGLTVGAIVGEWAEFWALSGGADTQRYAFSPDGRFEWQAAPGAAADPIRRRFGTWELAHHDRLVLHETGQELRATCADQTRPCQSVTETRSSDETLELGSCPPNDEARALDAAYRCMSIRGRAFWRRPGS